PESIRGAGVHNAGTLDTRETSIDGNYAGGYYSWGGGLYSSGTANLTDSTISGNSGEFDRGAGVQGAGIYNDQGGIASLVRTSVIGNDVGKGIVNLGSLSLTDGVIAGNGGWRGGALLNQGGTATLKNTSVLGNGSGVGGFFAVTSVGGSLTLEQCTVAQASGENGGGVAGASRIINSTISGNDAYRGTGGVFAAGTIIASTIAGNI